MAAFMEVLDTSIANVALPYMAGNLGASNDESTWILTSYLVSNAIVLPMSAWFAGVFGRKRFFLMCLAIFTISSLLCGIAPSLGTIILFRVLQGAGGGGLQPVAQSILADTFPPEQRGLAFALYGTAKSNSIAGLVNFMRNIGSSIGTSMVTTLIARRAQFHQGHLVANASPGQPTFMQSVEALAAHLTASGLDAAQATSQAYARVYQAMIGQATTLAYIDTFWVLCIGAAIMFILSFALKRNQPGGGGEVAVG